ncbi:PA0069 family radical SAM protein [Beijerinckia indica]|uniref:Radical SAM domain protein n=1 Tax=Beijerinckia indica subsp. indica (strain ATCC 9039 / DSM 1715 / NCIMB 8712) TaxID=395963 RepID=B2IHQ0_BEII9|nr:PA0069 family radical SAM protein [Beijerinckia indica]ACB94571.1 Radical SAM domain protein [Beijerinckia indica subsp. indica ATCC 9039]
MVEAGHLLKQNVVKTQLAPNWLSVPSDRVAIKDVLPTSERRGRGAVSNRGGRFEQEARQREHDGWHEEEPPPLATSVTPEKVRTLITHNDSPDIGFDRSINPYRGCEHGCIYCFARPTHAYQGLSPGLDFETKLFAKAGAAAALERELAAPSYRPKTIAIGTNTDPYQPIERQQRVTRQILEVLARTNHPVALVTKSALVLRDLDLLAPMAQKGLVKIAISVTTLDAGLARKMEPRASTPERRLEAMRLLSEAGVPVSLLLAPIIPGLNDSEIETILTRVHALGVREAGYVMLRLPLELRDLFSEWLMEHAPAKARHVLSLVQSVRGGKLYDATFGKRMTGTGPYAWMVGRRFEIALAKLGFSKSRKRLRSDLFQPPMRESAQLCLF